MKLKKKQLSDFYKIQFISNNELKTAYVSHEEHYEPDKNDGDFAEPWVALICGFYKRRIKKGSLMNNKKEPMMYIDKTSVLPIK